MADANHSASTPAKKSGTRRSTTASGQTATSATSPSAASTSAASAAYSESAEPVYLLSEAAHSQLRAVQECLHLLSLLTQSRAEDPMVPPEAWVGCLHLLTMQLQSALDAAPWRAAA